MLLRWASQVERKHTLNFVSWNRPLVLMLAAPFKILGGQSRALSVSLIFFKPTSPYVGLFNNFFGHQFPILNQRDGVKISLHCLIISEISLWENDSLKKQSKSKSINLPWDYSACLSKLQSHFESIAFDFISSVSPPREKKTSMSLSWKIEPVVKELVIVFR